LATARVVAGLLPSIGHPTLESPGRGS